MEKGSSLVKKRQTSPTFKIDEINTCVWLTTEILMRHIGYQTRFSLPWLDYTVVPLLIQSHVSSFFHETHN